jgi:hypothetical protein
VVTLDGRGLEGATVDFVPEEFLGSDARPASGVTGPGGMTMVSVPVNPADPGATGVAPGFYRVEITSKGGTAIPAKYNIETTLGCEVAKDSDWQMQGNLRFDLTSR